MKAHKNSHWLSSALEINNTWHHKHAKARDSQISWVPQPMYVSVVAHLRNPISHISAAMLKLYGGDMKGKDCAGPHPSRTMMQLLHMAPPLSHRPTTVTGYHLRGRATQARHFTDLQRDFHSPDVGNTITQVIISFFTFPFCTFHTCNIKWFSIY